MSERDMARERAVERLASVERTLAAPRPDGPLHAPPNSETFEEWRGRLANEAPSAPAVRSAPPRNSLAAMGDDELAQLLGYMIGTARREVMVELEALSGLVGDLEQRIAKLEGTPDA